MISGFCDRTQDAGHFDDDVSQSQDCGTIRENVDDTGICGFVSKDCNTLFRAQGHTV